MDVKLVSVDIPRGTPRGIKVLVRFGTENYKAFSKSKNSQQLPYRQVGGNLMNLCVETKLNIPCTSVFTGEKVANQTLMFAITFFFCRNGFISLAFTVKNIFPDLVVIM